MTSDRRLFIALWPDAKLRQQLQLCQQNLLHQDRALSTAKIIPAQNLHLTLRFLGAVRQGEADELCQRLANIRHQCFQLELDSLGYFRRPRILWLGLNTSSPVLLQLLARINAAVEEALPEIKTASTEFTAHVSLFKNADDLPAYKSFDSLLWQVKDFVLVESSSQQSEVKYQVLHRWPLC